MRAIPSRGGREQPAELQVRCSASPGMPPAPLPKVLVYRTEQVLAAMRKIEASMDEPDLDLEELQRRQARIIHWAEHVHWFAGGILEQQVAELKHSLLRLGSKEAGKDGSALAAHALAGSHEGVQLGLRLIGREGDDRELGRRALLSARSSKLLNGTLDHLATVTSHLEHRLVTEAHAAKDPLLALGAIGEVLAPTNYETLDLPGATISCTPEAGLAMQAHLSNNNPLMRAAAVRGLAYAMQGAEQLRGSAELAKQVGALFTSEPEARVRYRIVGLVRHFAENIRGEALLTILERADPETQIPALHIAEGVEHHALGAALVRKFQKVIDSEALGVPSATYCALATSVRGKLPAEFEGKLRSIVLDGRQPLGRKALAAYALAGTRDEELEVMFFKMLKSSPDEQVDTPAAQALRKGCREEVQSALVKLAIDPRGGMMVRMGALSALPANTSIQAQRELLALLRSEDDDTVLAECVETFRRFRELGVRKELREMIKKNQAREEGRAAAIEILGKPEDGSELMILQHQLQEGALQCRVAAAGALCLASLNGIDSQQSFALLHDTIKETLSDVGASGGVSGFGSACNVLLRSTGLL